MRGFFQEFSIVDPDLVQSTIHPQLDQIRPDHLSRALWSVQNRQSGDAVCKQPYFSWSETDCRIIKFLSSLASPDLDLPHLLILLLGFSYIHDHVFHSLTFCLSLSRMFTLIPRWYLSAFLSILSWFEGIYKYHLVLSRRFSLIILPEENELEMSDLTRLSFFYSLLQSVTGKEAQMQRLMAVNSEIDVCYNFTLGDRNKGEFYSPMYPNNYPNNTECIALITGKRQTLFSGLRARFLLPCETRNQEIAFEE